MPLSIKNTELNSFTSRINNPGRVNLNSKWNRFRMRHSIQDSFKELFSGSGEIREPERFHVEKISFKKLASTAEPIDYRRLRRALCRVKNNPLYKSACLQQKIISHVETILERKKNPMQELNLFDPTQRTYLYRNYSTMEYQTRKCFKSKSIFHTNPLKNTGDDIMPLHLGARQNLDQSSSIPILKRLMHSITRSGESKYGVTHLSNPLLLTKDKLSQLASNAKTNINHYWLAIMNWDDCLRNCKAFFLWISQSSHKQMKQHISWRMPITQILFYFIRSSMRRVHYGFYKPILGQIN